MNENIFFLIILVCLFNPYIIQNTNIFVSKLNKAFNIKGCQVLFTLFLNFIIFIFIVYLYKKYRRDHFSLCRPGFKMSNVHDSFFHPEKAWCEYGRGKKGYKTSDADLIDSLESGTDSKNQYCEGDYENASPNESYFDSRKSWCTNKD